MQKINLLKSIKLNNKSLFRTSVAFGHNTVTQYENRSYAKKVLRDGFATLADKDLTKFEGMLDKSGVITDADIINPHNRDWTNKFVGSSKLLLRPKTTEEVSAILKYCNDRKLAVVPQGGNTGLVGGSTPVHDEIILNTGRMNNIMDFNESYGILSTQAGVILADCQSYVRDRGYVMPLDLGAKGSCMIGGNLATNAGGIHFIKFNSMHANCVGLKAVMANGQILDNMTTLRKDNTGYDLKHLFIGSEGTLGIITECAMLCPPMATSKNLAVLAVSSYEGCQRILCLAKQQLGDILQAVEFMDEASMEVVQEKLPTLTNPFSQVYPFYIHIEVAESSSDDDGESASGLDRLMSFLEDVDEEDVVDGVVAQDEKQFETLWGLRERIGTATVAYGYTLKYDISLQADAYYRVVEATREHVRMSSKFTDAEKARIHCNGHGHIGDGNMHLNIAMEGYEHSPETQARFYEMVDPFIMQFCRDNKGSVSAEHGIGYQKPNYLHYSKTNEMIDVMRQIKGVFDPNGILNPYKVLPSH